MIISNEDNVMMLWWIIFELGTPQFQLVSFLFVKETKIKSFFWTVILSDNFFVLFLEVILLNLNMQNLRLVTVDMVGTIIKFTKVRMIL